VLFAVEPENASFVEEAVRTKIIMDNHVIIVSVEEMAFAVNATEREKKNK
jgi:hypothetical protein